MPKKARTFGQDLMRGEGPKWAGRQAGSSNPKPGLTWVGGNRQYETLDDTSRKILAAGTNEPTGTSIFDPVLCELVYRWFCPEAGKILDPFAGGSVRGIVAGLLGFDYCGLELSKRQIEANRAQAKDILHTGANGWAGKRGIGRVQWIEGDARRAAALAPGNYDLIFSCPPYGNLEVYSEDPRDLSTMPHEHFVREYQAIIAECAQMLKPDRFACFVVGDYRDQRGFYRNFPADTIEAFANCGLRLYNEAVLITMIGSLPIRVGKQFTAGRKLGKTHQNILIFYRGDPKQIVKNFQPIQIESLDPEPGGIAENQSPGQTVEVKVSAASARLRFNGCEPDYINDICHAHCCESSTSPTGTLITIHPSEESTVIERGGKVTRGLLQPRPGEKKCPFKTAVDLCGLHGTTAKPFGCIASPFTVNKKGTLIVRNRYKLLKCYNDGHKLPAYVAFHSSLILLFGESEAAKIAAHFDGGGGDIIAPMSLENFNKLIENDEIKHSSSEGRS